VTSAPFHGLDSFSEADADLFFGRDRESEILAASLLTGRLPLVHGEPGVGKSSILRAGVLPRLYRLAQENVAEHGSPLLAPVFFADWRTPDPLAELAQAIRDAVGILIGEMPPPGSLEDTVTHCATVVDGPILLILDQVEEVSVFHADAVPILDEVARVGTRAHLLLSLRDEAVVQLLPLKQHLPRLFDNPQRIAALDREQAQRAILGPLQRDGVRDPASTVVIETELVDAVLDQVLVDQTHVDVRLLQVVMLRLWHDAVLTGSSVLRLETLERMGGARGLLVGVVDDVLDGLQASNRSAVARMLSYLVTPRGATVALRADDLALFADLPRDQVAKTLDALTAQRILRPVAGSAEPAVEPAYMLFADLLVDPILIWIARNRTTRRTGLRSAFDRIRGGR
jgi:eukaryotic-like serine/threonine-protein kinase